MRRISLYGHVIELLEMLETSREPADQLAGRFLRERRYLGARDRRFINELYFDILRNRKLLGFYARQGMSQADSVIPVTHVRHLGDARGGPGVPPVALLTAHQLHLAGEDPAALLPDVADLWRMVGAIGDVDVLLAAIRASAIPDAVLEDPVARISLQHSFPEEIVGEWVERFGERTAEQLCAASNTPAPTTIRVNTLKCTREECQAALAREGVTSSTTRHSPDGLILEKRVNTGALESFRAGMFEMQDEASQLVSLLVNPVPGTTVVDACAGAGGKSLHLAALMRGEGTVHAFDSDAVRLRSLSTRASRAGAGNIHTAAIEVSAPVDESLTGAADVLLIDAPCSGVGTYRRNPGAKSGFSVGYSAALGELQDSLLQRYHRVVRPGGRLVYATCTLLRRENEGVIERFLGEHPEYRLIPASSVVGSLGVPTAYDPFLFLLPHETGTDGFFGAVLERVAVSS